MAMTVAVEMGVPKQEGDPQAISWVLQERSGMNQTWRAPQKCSEVPNFAAARQRELISQNDGGLRYQVAREQGRQRVQQGGQRMGMAVCTVAFGGRKGDA